MKDGEMTEKITDDSLRGLVDENVLGFVRERGILGTVKETKPGRFRLVYDNKCGCSVRIAPGYLSAIAKLDENGKVVEIYEF